MDLKLSLWLFGASLLCVFTPGMLQIQTDSPSAPFDKIPFSNLDYMFLKVEDKTKEGYKLIANLLNYKYKNILAK